MRLWLKFLLATGGVVVISLIVVGVLAGTVIRRQFARFSQTQQQQVLEQLAAPLEEYYGRTGSWAGVEALFRISRARGAGAGQGRILLVDADRQVIYDSRGEAVDQIVPREVWETGVSITFQGEEVGRLVSAASFAEARRLNLGEQSFVHSVARALLGASVAGAVAAIIVATVLALQITAPARELTRGARRVAAGDLEHRVDVQSHDELGEVGVAFNEMATALAHQEEMRQSMVADIAHELRTPLAVMKVELDSLKDGLAQSTPELIASLGEEVDLLGRLVEDLRLLSTMDAGQLRLELEPVDLAQMIPNVAQQVNTVAERKGVDLETALPPDLPEARADPDRLRQVLLNLLSNALRHTRSGGQVRLEAGAEVGELHLRVVDTGEGIGVEDLPHIFDRFYRADSSRSRTTGGSGLGLTIARGLIEAMGGRIWADSVPGQGTTIHFTLPIAAS